MAKALKEPGGVAAKVEALLRGPVEEMGLFLWDVRFEKEGSLWFLRVLIDEEGGLDMNRCEEATRLIDPLLDEADPIEQSYCLEVGSPGLGRKLARQAHFDAMQGREVLAALYAPGPDGQKEVRGALLGLADGVVRLETPGGEVAVPAESAAYFKLCDDEGLFD